MLTREITFYCQQGLSITQAKQLNRLAGMFKSTIRCANLTRRQTVAASNQLSLLTLATQPGDLCQLQIEGCDAELAHMAFTCWCGELGQPLVRPRTAALAELRLANALPDYHFALRQLAHSPEPLIKAEALEHLIQSAARRADQQQSRAGGGDQSARAGLGHHHPPRPCHAPCIERRDQPASADPA